MKIIHCADVHLDARQMASMTKEQISIRKMENLHTFSRMVEYAEKNDVSIILISGNLFDTRNISANIRSQVLDIIISHPQMDFIYLQGSERNDNFLARVEDVPSNLLLFGHEWQSFAYGPVVITGTILPTKSEAEGNTFLEEIRLQSDKFNIVMLQGNPDDVPWKKLRNRKIDYLAMGGCDTYRFSQLDTRGYICYPGSLEGHSFEACEDHGVILIDIDDKTLRPSYGFVAMASRNYYVATVDMTGVYTTKEASGRIQAAIKNGGYPSSSLMRIILTGNLDINSYINKTKLEERFREAFFYVEIVDQTKLTQNLSDFELDTSLRGEFIRNVLRSDLDEDKKMEIIRCGIDLLAGEEVTE